MTGSKAFCPSCEAVECKPIGPIPSNDRFAGNILERPLPGGVLYACPSCALYFRHPRPSAELLKVLYAAGRTDIWQEGPEKRRDWTIAAGHLGKNLPDGASVLDVGCYDGRFLSSLRAGFEKYGVEVNTAATKEAEKRGVRIVAAGIDGLTGIQRAFDAAVSFDVIEHVEDPLAFLGTLKRVTRPGGLIIISSGNSEAPTWRFMGSKYWYCSFCEHISFINLGWARHAAQRLGLEVEMAERFVRKGGGFRALWFTAGLALNLLYLACPPAVGTLRYLKGSKRGGTRLSTAPPVWPGAKDHLLLVLRVR